MLSPRKAKKKKRRKHLNASLTSKMFKSASKLLSPSTRQDEDQLGYVGFLEALVRIESHHFTHSHLKN